ncbi:MAG: hypothetical protein AAGA66_00865 [Bacteroidota bacterium]
MKEESTDALSSHLGRLFSDSLRIHDPVSMLHLIREKIHATSYKPFYKQEILDELGRLQRLTRELNSDMLRIFELLQKEG